MLMVRVRNENITRAIEISFVVSFEIGDIGSIVYDDLLEAFMS